MNLIVIFTLAVVQYPSNVKINSLPADSGWTAWLTVLGAARLTGGSTSVAPAGKTRHHKHIWKRDGTGGTEQPLCIDDYFLAMLLHGLS